MKLYLKVNVLLLLLKDLKKFGDTMLKYVPSWFITTPFSAMAAVLLRCKKNVELVTKIDVINEIESSVRGGFNNFKEKLHLIINHYLMIIIKNHYLIIIIINHYSNNK